MRLVNDLWSGAWGAILGAVFGGVVTGLATLLTVWWQTKRLLTDERQRAKEARDDERRDALSLRENQTLARLLPVLNDLEEAVPVLYAHPRYVGDHNEVHESYRTRAMNAFEGLRRGLRVEVPLITDTEIRRRYLSMFELAHEVARLGLAQVDPSITFRNLYEKGREMPRLIQDARAERQRQRADVVRYIGYVRHTIKNALHGVPLPKYTEPPNLAHVDGAPWSAVETDPEEVYFPPQEPSTFVRY